MARYCPNCDRPVLVRVDGYECPHCHIEWLGAARKYVPTSPIGDEAREASWQRAAKAAGVEA